MAAPTPEQRIDAGGLRVAVEDYLTEMRENLAVANASLVIARERAAAFPGAGGREAAEAMRRAHLALDASPEESSELAGALDDEDRYARMRGGAADVLEAAMTIAEGAYAARAAEEDSE